MHEFKSDGRDFVRRTRLRFVLELLIIVGLAACLLVVCPEMLPTWAVFSMLVFVVLLLATDLLFYRKGKAIAETFSIKLLNDALEFSHVSGGGQISYGDLHISKVKKKNGQIVELSLRTAFGQTIKLRNLDNMEELYVRLSGFLK